MNTLFTELDEVDTVLAPSADVFNGDPSTAKIDMALCDHACFTLHKGAGAVGTAKVTVVAYTRAGADPTPVGFHWRRKAVGGAWTDVTQVEAADAATGFTTTAGANQVYAIEVQGMHRVDGHPLIGLALEEVVDDPVVGVVTAVSTRLRYTGTAKPVLYIA